MVLLQGFIQKPTVTNDGLPYSMDFVLDERSDGIHVYTFVVKYTVSGSTFTNATLKGLS